MCFFKKFLQVYHFNNFGNLPLYTFWKLKKVELVKNDLSRAHIVIYSYILL